MGATIKDIARETGLGLATISSYLNGRNVREKNRIKIEAAIEKLHFEVNETARGLKTNRTRTIGILIPELNNVFCAEIISEAEDILRQKGYATILCDCRTDPAREREAIAFLLRRRADGLMVMPTGENGEILKAFLRRKRPVVVLDRKIMGLDADCVLVDNEDAAKKAVDRFRAAGHTKIGLITGPQDIYTAAARRRGFQAAMADAGLEVSDSMVVCGDYTIQGGARAMHKLREEEPEITAVLVANYEMTVGAMIEINESGIQIPEELSVIGFDNLEFAKAIAPRLSIITQPTREIAREAVDLLLTRLSGDAGRPTQTVVLPTDYVEGKSVGVRAEEVGTASSDERLSDRTSVRGIYGDILVGN